MNPGYVYTLYNYNYWANARILDAARQVSEQEYFAPQPVSFDSLHGTLVHIMTAEWLWRRRMQEGVSPPSLHTGADFATLTELQDFWHAEELGMRQFLAGLTDNDLHGKMRYTNTQGQENIQPLWQPLTHLVLHGMQHRSEAAMLLTTYGHSPGWIDFIVFMREHPPH